MFIIVFMFCLLVCFGPWNLKRWETMFYCFFCKCSEPLPTYGGFLWIFPSNSWKVWLGWLGRALDGQDQRIRRIYSLIHLFGRVESPNMGTQQPGGFHESSCGAWFFLSTQEIRLGTPRRAPRERRERPPRKNGDVIDVTNKINNSFWLVFQYQQYQPAMGYNINREWLFERAGGAGLG